MRPRVRSLRRVPSADDRGEGIAGVKYALEDPVKLGEAIAAGDDVVWVDGLAEPHAVSFWAQGTDGFTADVTNVAPRLGLALLSALREGEWERARALQSTAVPYRQSAVGRARTTRSRRRSASPP